MSGVIGISSHRRSRAQALAILAAAAMGLAAPAVARADIADWEVNEVVASVGGDPAVRFIELTNAAGGCLFPSSRVELRGADGGIVLSIPLVTATHCYEPGWYLWLATPAAAARFGLPTDGGLTVPIDPAAGQVCFTSSGTIYDCVRWGALSAIVTDFFGADDLSLAPQPVDGVALARVQTTHVVSADWALQSPTPRAPNDGTPWTPPDAGPMPDAAPGPDARPRPDAGPIVDAGPDAAPRPDAGNDDYLDVTPTGGAACSCRAGERSGRSGAPILLLLGALFVARRRRPPPRPSPARGGGESSKPSPE